MIPINNSNNYPINNYNVQPSRPPEKHSSKLENLLEKIEIQEVNYDEIQQLISEEPEAFASIVNSIETNLSVLSHLAPPKDKEDYLSYVDFILRLLEESVEPSSFDTYNYRPFLDKLHDQFRKNVDLAWSLFQDLRSVKPKKKYSKNTHLILDGKDEFFKSLDVSLKNNFEFVTANFKIDECNLYHSLVNTWPKENVLKLAKKNALPFIFLKHGSLWKKNDFDGYFSTIKELYEANPSTLKYTADLLFSLFSVGEKEVEAITKGTLKEEEHPRNKAVLCWIKVASYFINLNVENFSCFDLDEKNFQLIVEIRNTDKIFKYSLQRNCFGNLILPLMEQKPEIVLQTKNNKWIYEDKQILDIVKNKPTLLLKFLNQMEQIPLKSAQNEMLVFSLINKTRKDSDKMDKPVLIKIFSKLFWSHHKDFISKKK